MRMKSSSGSLGRSSSHNRKNSDNGVLVDFSMQDRNNCNKPPRNSKKSSLQDTFIPSINDHDQYLHSSTDSSDPSPTGSLKKRKYTYFTRAKNKATINNVNNGKVFSPEELQQVVMSYSIDPYDYDDETLIKMTMLIFEHYNLFQDFHFNAVTATHFMRLVRDYYNPENFFHNFKHAWGVMHMCFHILLKGGEKYLNKFDILSIFVAALCHDVGHPGNSNAFEFATKSEVSKVYAMPDEACVLERYHASVTHKLLKPESGLEHDIIAALTTADRDRFHKQVDFIIMGTDMAKHVSLVEETREFSIKHAPEVMNKLAALREQSNRENPHNIDQFHNGSSSRAGKKSNNNLQRACASRCGQQPSECLLSDDERRALTRIIVHSADIGAQTQSQEVATKWLDRIYAEYRYQADRERHLGIMTSPFLHDLKEESKIFSTQFNFINDFVQPIWSALATMIPDLQFALEQLIANKAHYKEFF